MSKPHVNIPHLLEEPPVIVYPSLAKIFGINAAIILQKLHFLISQAKEVKSKTNYVSGQWWAYNSYREWQEDHFPWLSEHTIQVLFLELEKQGIVIAECLSKHKSDRRKWYTINYDVLQSTIMQKMHDDHAENAQSTIMQKMHDDSSGTTESSTDSIAPQENGAVSPEWIGNTPIGEPVQRTWGKSELDDTPINTQPTIDSSSTVQYDKPAAPGNITDKQWLNERKVWALAEAWGVYPTKTDWSGYQRITNQLTDAGISYLDYGQYVTWVKSRAKQQGNWDGSIFSLTSKGRTSEYKAHASQPKPTSEFARYIDWVTE